jgi:imidazolonepropionase-like amidohydrolase
MRHRRGATGQPGRGEDVGVVAMDGVLAQTPAQGDSLVAQALGHEPQDFDLPQGQATGSRGLLAVTASPGLELGEEGVAGPGTRGEDSRKDGKGGKDVKDRKDGKDGKARKDGAWDHFALSPWSAFTAQKGPKTQVRMRSFSLVATTGIVLAMPQSRVATQAPESVRPVEIAFVDVNLIPMDRKEVIAHQTVLVQGDRILSIGPVGKVIPGSNALQIDGRGKYLMPGLVDMHIHLFNSKDLLLYLANGVTTVRNLGGYAASDSILQIRREVAEGRRLGPAIYSSGNWLDGDPPYRKINTVVRTPAEARAVVERQRAEGYDFIKVYQNLSPRVYREIVRVARAQGIPVTGHIPTAVGVDGVLESGQVGVDHVGQFMGEGPPEPLAQRVRRARISVTTTLVMLRLAFTLRGAPELVESLLARPEARYLSPATRQFWRDAPYLEAPRMPDAMERLGEAQKLLRAFHDESVPLTLGTDAGLWGNPPGFSALEELRLLVESGLTPYEALRAATVTPAEFLNRYVRAARQPGVIAKGGRADLLLLEANPLVDVSNASRRAGVMARGQWFAEERLRGMMEELARGYAIEPAPSETRGR